MQNKLKEKLENLNVKFSSDLDIISLKALCCMPETEEIIFAITGTLQRLIGKYPEEKEILDLLPQKEKISFEDLLKTLEENYSNNVEIITVKALLALPESEEKENAIKKCLERLLEENPDDEILAEYLEKEICENSIEEDIILEDPHENMIFVEGGSYVPSFFTEERDVFDLFVSKYLVTQEEWNLFDLKTEDEPLFSGNQKPIERISWINCLEFCNKLSEFYGLQPVYKIREWDKKLEGIIYKNGEIVDPKFALFEKTEGYRLPTELEWEWFARGGKLAIQNGTFNTRYSGSDNLGGVAWCRYNSNQETHNVGLKKPNALGLYDCSGNVSEWCYDSQSDNEYLPKERAYQYNSEQSYKVYRSSDFESNEFGEVLQRYNKNITDYASWLGFRIVRTAKTKI